MYYTYRYASPLGGITMASDGVNLTGLWFDGQKYFAADLPESHTEKYLCVFGQTEQWLDFYFSGKAPDFAPPLSMHGISSFRKRVWEILLTIPFGQVTSYGKIAAQMAGETGKPVSAQAVGGAVGHNAISLIIPCHRVVFADGRICEGFAFGGPEVQRALLEEEGVAFRDDTHVDLDISRWPAGL